MNTIENNKIIAEFMGLSKTKMFFNLKTGNYVKIETDECEAHATEVYLKNNKPITMFYYHKDWNWLMEVVEKIETMGGAVCIGNGNCVMIIFYLTDVMGESYSETRELTGETKIEATYNACVEFIKWYNENKI
jgi:hypothetical protein